MGVVPRTGQRVGRNVTVLGPGGSVLSVSQMSSYVQGAPLRCSLLWESREPFLLELDKTETGNAVIPVLTEK